MEECEVCVEMENTGLFTPLEIEDYHNGNLTMRDFDKRRVEVIQEIYSTLDGEEEDA